MISKYINGGAFAIILICFVLPFVSIKCNTVKLVELKGYDLIVGKTIDAEANPMVKEMSAFGKRLDGNDESNDSAVAESDAQDNNEKIKTNWFMVLVLVSALIGLILSFTNTIKKGLGAILPAILALVGLLTFIVVMNYQLQEQAGAGSDGSFGVKIKLGYEVGFWLMLLLLLFIIAYNIYINYIAIKANAPDQAEPALDEPPQHFGNG